MGFLKSKLRRLAASLPPFRRLLAERDDLRQKNASVARELNDVRAKFLTAWQQREELFTPPGHFYSPIPAIRDVKLNEEEIFESPPAIRGVNLNEKGQLALLKQFEAFYPDQPFTAKAAPDRRYSFENPNYSYNDAIILYCFMRYAQPRRIVEIGSGYSSRAILDVNEIFFKNSIACTFIEPFPQLLRDGIKESDYDRIRILEQKVQEVDLDVFRELKSSDILFIDSSHITKTGSDVNYIVFKILPLLEDGVWIHFHDIFYPFEYPAEWVYEGRGWNEAYLLRAFLQYNETFEIQFFNSFLIEKHRQTFKSAMPLCFNCGGANLWLKKVRRHPELDRMDEPKKRKRRPVPHRLDVARPEHAWCLKKGWYEPEGDRCWMTGSATFQIAGPTSAGRSLTINAESPFDTSQVSAMADGIPLGSLLLDHPGEVCPEFPLPDSLIGREFITVDLSINRIHTAPPDSRALGLSVRRIELR